MKILQWRHKCAWNHLRLNWLCNRLFRRRSKKTWKPRVDSPHKGPVARKMIPFHDVIMNAMDSCRCETIFWPPIYWPRGQYIIRYFDPFTIFWPPPNSASNSFVCYVQLLNLVYCYMYMIFMNVWVELNESIIDTQEIINMILILSYIFPSKYERQRKLCRWLFQGVKVFRGWGWGCKMRVGIYFGCINKSYITIQEIIDIISI